MINFAEINGKRRKTWDKTVEKENEIEIDNL